MIDAGWWSSTSRPPASCPAWGRPLHEQGLVEQLGAPGQIPLLVASHPHLDHIGGMSDLLKQVRPGCIEQFWDPGFYSPNPSFMNLMRDLEGQPAIRRLQPTSGTSQFLDTLRLTVMAPSVGLRMRFDTYGVQVNDASLVLMAEFPATRLYSEPAADRDGT